MPIPGETLRCGWGVVRMRPWHLAGIFITSGEAEALAESLGPDYAVRFGEQAPGSGEFDITNAPASSA